MIYLMLQIKFLREIYLAMINIDNMNNSEPYNTFRKYYEEAKKKRTKDH